MQDGLHGGPPLYHISVMYELFPVGPGDGGFGCVAGSHLPGARIGPDRSSPLGAGHVPWGRPPWTPEVDRCVTRVEGQPGQAIIFTERLVHTTLPWTGRGERRSLFLKYCPYGLHYTDQRYDTTLPGLSEEQRQIMSYPDGDVFLNEARNKKSPYYVPGKVLGQWEPLPAATMPRL